MALGNILGIGQQQPNILGGGMQQPRIPWGQNQAVTMAALGMLGAPTLNQGLQRAGQMVPVGMAANIATQDRMMTQADKARTRAAMNAAIKLKSKMPLTPEDQAALDASPEVMLQFGFPDKKDLMAVGSKIYDATEGKWITPPGGAGGPYEGTGMDNQNWNIVLTGDPASPQYAAAYSQLFSERMEPSIDAAGNQVIVPIKPVIPPSVRPPVGGPPPPQRSEQQAGGDPRVGAPIVIGNPKPSDAAMNAALYADRMAKSDEIITDLERAGTSYQDAAASQVPLGIGNYLISDDYRQLEQAQRDFVNATLRRESGAVISPQEFENAKKQYFPQPGDDPKTIEQKRENRQTAIDGIARAAGPSYTPPEPSPGTAGGDDGWTEVEPGVRIREKP